MNTYELSPGIHKISVNLTEKTRFEGLWPIPNGVSVNAYVVKGDKIALIDTVEDDATAPGQYERTLRLMDVTPDKVSYLVVNHMEPDHSGWIPHYIAQNPHIEIICTQRTVSLLKSFFNMSFKTRVVRTGDTLDLGGGKILEFHEALNVHWPETMVTFETSSGILFSCDAFGAYGAVGDDEFTDEQVSDKRLALLEEETIRYYANILTGFSSFVTKAISALETLPIKIIAPSHGVVWKKNPQYIVDLYKKFADYAISGGEREICIVWGSMYGNTQKAVEAAIEVCRKSGVPFCERRVPETEVGFILADAWRCKGLILAMPTYEYKMFPPMLNFLNIVQRKHFFNKKVLRFGSYGWTGGAEREFLAVTSENKWQIERSIEWEGGPSDDDLATIKDRVEKFIENL